MKTQTFRMWKGLNEEGEETLFITVRKLFYTAEVDLSIKDIKKIINK